MKYTNDLFLRALKGEEVERPPVWMMRQAGRYLPEFRALRQKYDFFTRCQTPELASELTVQPIRIIGTDAAILFSDILVVPQAMGIEIELQDEIGPVILEPIRSLKQIEQLPAVNIQERLNYVMQAIKLTKEKLNNQVPLIGFAGAPWTIFCYVVQGRGSKSFDKAKEFCFKEPVAAHMLLQKITDATINYLKEKIKAGVDAIQIFDSWAGMLSFADYQEFSWKYIQQILEALNEEVPTIVFAKGAWFYLSEMAESKATALGIDWTCTPKMARELTKNKKILQGNLDPSRLLSPINEIQKNVHQMIDDFGRNNYIVNLGHGILPNIPVSHAQAFVDAVKNYQPQ